MIKNNEKQINKLSAMGFTLIEVMITVAIIGILAAIAIPNYSDSVRKGLRVDATEALMRLAVAQEKYFIQHGTYTTDINSSTGLNNQSSSSAKDYYSLSAIAGPTGKIATSYQITALATGNQAKDTDCQKFIINSRNQRTATDSSGASTKKCW